MGEQAQAAGPKHVHAPAAEEQLGVHIGCVTIHHCDCITNSGCLSWWLSIKLEQSLPGLQVAVTGTKTRTLNALQ